MKMVLGLSVILAGVGLCAPAMAQERDLRSPTATEVLNLRSKCEELGQAILDQQPFKSRTFPAQASHYDPCTNRCYAELAVLTDDIKTIHRYLYDGQTKEMLAHAARVNGKKEGQIFNNQPNPPGIAGYFEATEYIDQMMAEESE